MNYLNIDSATNHIKNIADSNRCYTCDQLNYSCVRYPCGHWTCDECIKVAECCLLCITPPKKITHFKDKVLNSRVEHASKLVLAFQDLFNIDVYSRQNDSKKLSIEKQLFPKCIQAPNKYYNKRKSSNSLPKGKENRPIFVLPGEEILNRSYIKMENKNTNIQQWINNIGFNESYRTPFSDLNGRKRTNKRIIEVIDTPIKKFKKDTKYIVTQLKSNINKNLCEKKCEKNESGIVIDDDIIEIEDSQPHSIDKDKLACMAIMQAESNGRKNSNISDESIFIEETYNISVDRHLINTSKQKVPFYRKGILHKFNSLHDCCKEDTVNTNLKLNKPKNISISLETNSLTIDINVSSYNSNIVCSNVKTNAVVQTNDTNVSLDDSKCASSLEMLRKETYRYMKCNSTNLKPIVIDNSDTESNISVIKNTRESIEEINNSFGKNNHRTLTELDVNRDVLKPRHARRGHTPTSTDSSDKENFDPNRGRKSKNSNKKYAIKKKYLRKF